MNGIEKPCPRCRKASFLYFRTRDINRRVSEELFDYYRCPSCKLIFLSPIPENLSRYYTHEYYSSPPTLDQLSLAAKNERYKIELVQQFVKKGRLLEIGPAYGIFTLLAKQAGFETEAIEMDSRCCQFLTEVLGIRAYNESNLCATLKKTGAYDVIALWHVIEHLPDPWSALHAIAGTLLPGGIIVLASPNPDAFQFSILRRFWTHVDAPRHVELIPAALIMDEAKSLGLKAVLSTTVDPGGIGWNKFGWEFSLSNFFLHPRIKQYAQGAGRVINRILAPVEQAGLRGSAYTLVFQKR